MNKNVFEKFDYREDSRILRNVRFHLMFRAHLSTYPKLSANELEVENFEYQTIYDFQGCLMDLQEQANVNTS